MKRLLMLMLAIGLLAACGNDKREPEVLPASKEQANGKSIKDDAVA